MSRVGLRRVFAGGVGLGLTLAGWLAWGWGGRFATRAADDLGLLLFAIFATVCCMAAALRSPDDRQGTRRTWAALGAGLAAWSAGEVIWCYDELWQRLPQTPFPSAADGGYLLFPAGAAAALLLFPAGRIEQSRLRLFLDGLIITGSLFTLSWATVLGSVYRAGASSHFALSVALAYPLADLVLMTMTVMILAQAVTDQRLTLGLLTAGIVLMSAADSAFAYLTATNPYQTGNLIDLGWVAAFLLFGLAALSSSPVTSSDQRLPELPTRTRLWLPYLPLLLACVIGTSHLWPTLRSGPVPTVSLLLVIVVLGRQFLTVADNQRLLATVAHQAFHDPLTGLANRALFTDRLERAVQLQRRDLRPLAVMVLDLDGFKLINDQYGHHAGDELLVRVAERLIGSLRASDTVARLGGDEFAILIEHDPDAALQAAHRALDAFTPVFVVDGHPHTVRASIGLASAPAHSVSITADSLMRDADLAMYAAKRHQPGSLRIHPTDGPHTEFRQVGAPLTPRRSALHDR
jgi:diguanylate cyclase (GGDEF)-like protein